MQPTASPFSTSCRIVSRANALPWKRAVHPAAGGALGLKCSVYSRNARFKASAHGIACRQPLVYTSMNSRSFPEAPMDRPIAYDKLAREERFVRMRGREVAELKVARVLPPFPDLSSHESIKERVHGIMVGELQAMEGAGRSVCDFPDAPWDFTMDMARQTWDESRHVEIYLRLLEHMGGYAGEYPETTILWRCACAEDAAARVAGVNRGREGLAGAVFK